MASQPPSASLAQQAQLSAQDKYDHLQTKQNGTKGPTLTHTLEYPWEDVIKAYNTRFPTHPDFPYLRDTYTTEAIKGDELHRTRIVEIDFYFPGWMKKLTGFDYFHVREDSVTNFKDKTMTLKTTNITLSSMVCAVLQFVGLFDKDTETLALWGSVRMYEECLYKQHPENKNQTYKELTPYMHLTYCERHVCLGLKSRIESWCSNLFVARGKDAIKKEEEMLQHMNHFAA